MHHSSLFGECGSAAIPDIDGIVIESPVVGALRLTHRIGRGAWGVVYCAKSITDDKEYAVKCIDNGADEGGARRRSIAREAFLHQTCSEASPLVLKLHDVVEDRHAGLMYIITDLCEYGDLLDHISQGRFVGEDEHIRQVFLEIIDAVDACHKAGVYHRDLKPENIFVKKTGIVLGDFGLATTLPITDEFNTGSTPFMSPEVLGGLDSSEYCYTSVHADIWALGVILMNLIRSRPPWEIAQNEDLSFKWYLFRRKDFFYKVYYVSQEAQDIFEHIFVDTRKRISLAKLRERVLNVKTFWRMPTAEEIEVMPRLYENIFNAKLPTLDDDDVLDSDALSSSASVDFTTLDGDIVQRDQPTGVLYHAYRSATVSQEYRATTDSLDNVDGPRGILMTISQHEELIRDFGSSLSSFASNESDAESDADSDGPITPETHAADAGGASAPVALDDIDEIEELDISEMNLDSAFEAIALARRTKPMTVGEDPMPAAKPQVSARSTLWRAVRRMGVPLLG
ncbi:kinase-like domain-containing protein [Phellopilus nigrolimitatus]|nr:kinase-like domain-containing protein [Phellopilus nigrolimitatus]